MNNSLDPGIQKEMNAMHLSKAASKKQEKKDDCADGNELKSAAREARGRRVPQPWCSEKERCCDWLTLPSLPLHTISLACTLNLSLFPHTHTHEPSLFLALPQLLAHCPASFHPSCTWGSLPHYSVSHAGFLPEVNLDTFPIYILLISHSIFSIN